MDVKTVFQKLNLGKDVYKTQPGVLTPRVGSKVSKLHKSIYGLKQAYMSWNIRFNKIIKDFFFLTNTDEACVYQKVSQCAAVFQELYVDDILIIGSDVSMLLSINIYWLSKNFLHERPWRSNLIIWD